MQLVQGASAFDPPLERAVLALVLDDGDGGRGAHDARHLQADTGSGPGPSHVGPRLDPMNLMKRFGVAALRLEEVLLPVLLVLEN